MSHATSTCSRVLVLLLMGCLRCEPALAQSFGDYDGDGYIDGADFFAFGGCMTGPPAGPPGSGCDAFDDPAHAFDGRVDMADYAALQRVAGGGPAGCDGAPKRRYAGAAIGLPNATGCSAKISTHPTKLCGEPDSIIPSKSLVFCNVSKQPNPPTNMDLFMWAQTGYQRYREIGEPTVKQNIYAEIKRLGPLAPDNPVIQYDPVHPWPENGVHLYRCWMPQQDGKWFFTHADHVAWTNYTHPNWAGVAGNAISWTGETHHEATDMVGVKNNECVIKECTHQQNFSPVWNTATLQEANLVSTDKTKWGRKLISPSEIQIWDEYPNP